MWAGLPAARTRLISSALQLPIATTYSKNHWLLDIPAAASAAQGTACDNRLQKPDEAVVGLQPTNSNATSVQHQHRSPGNTILNGNEQHQPPCTYACKLAVHMTSIRCMAAVGHCRLSASLQAQRDLCLACDRQPWTRAHTCSCGGRQGWHLLPPSQEPYEALPPAHKEQTYRCVASQLSVAWRMVTRNHCSSRDPLCSRCTALLTACCAKSQPCQLLCFAVSVMELEALTRNRRGIAKVA